MDHLENLKLIVGLVATVIGGIWTAFVYLDSRKARSRPDGDDAARSRATGSRGVAAGRDAMVVHSKVSAFPPAAAVVLLAGLALVGWSLFQVGRTPAIQEGDVTNDCGAATRGDIIGSTIAPNC